MTDQRNKKNRGFTLLEVMMVVLIISALTLLVMPRVFGIIETSRSTEVFGILGSIRRSMERCYSLNDGSYANCAAIEQLDITDPNEAPGSNFSYVIEIIDTTYTITATRNDLNGGDGTSQIMLILAPTGVIKAGSGAFSNIN